MSNHLGVEGHVRQVLGKAAWLGSSTMLAKEWLTLTQRQMLKAAPAAAEAKLRQIYADAPALEANVLQFGIRADVGVSAWLPALLFTPRAMRRMTRDTFSGTCLVAAFQGLFLIEPVRGELQFGVPWHCVCRCDLKPLRGGAQVFAFAFMPLPVMEERGFVRSAVDVDYLYVADADDFFKTVIGHSPDMVAESVHGLPELIPR